MRPDVDLAALNAWARTAVAPTGEITIERERPWATILRVPSREGTAWIKACAPVQGFEPRLTAELAARWPDRVARVLASHPERGWLITADAGAPLERLGNPPELWLRVLPMYARLQIGEIQHVPSHLDRGVPDLRLERLPAVFAELLASAPPVNADELEHLHRFAPTFTMLCRDLDESFPAASVQHDDLHHRSVFSDGTSLRILDWGDASIGHPFFSLVVPFQFLEEINGLRPDDPWLKRLRDAYLEPWGPGLQRTFHAAQRVGLVAHALTWLRQRRSMPLGAWPPFDRAYPELLRSVLRRAVNPDV